MPLKPALTIEGIPNATLTALVARCDEALEQAQVAGWA